MKTTKRIAALFLAAIMFASVLVLPSSAATATLTQLGSTSNVTSDGAVKYSRYNVYGSQSKHTEEVDILQFNPNDGYIPMAFSAYSGSVSLLDAHYSMATNKYGYEVAGIINGSYFTTSNGRLNGLVITNGKVACASEWSKQSVVAFDSNGKMSVVDSRLAFDLYFDYQSDSAGDVNVGLVGANGEIYDFRDINKTHASTLNSYDTAFFYYDTSCGNVTDSAASGFEIVCQKMNHTDLTVGGAVVGKVLEIKKNTYATKFAEDGDLSDKFVIYVKNGTYDAAVNKLTVGDKITVKVEESIAASKSVMENAVSVITNVGFLVKNGVDQTLINATIGDHNVAYTYARWTAFGTKPDGTYVFFTSEGGATGTSSRSLTLRDVAAAMIQMGCTNVIRLDGGGSTAMYTGNGGYLCPSSRKVADCLMIVKKSSLADSKITSALRSAIKIGEMALQSTSNSTISSLVSKGKQLLNSGVVVAADARKIVTSLKVANDIALKAAMDKSDATDKSGYTATQLVRINNAYNHCKSMYKATYYDASDIEDAIEMLNYMLAQSGGTVTPPVTEPEYTETAATVTGTNSKATNVNGEINYYPNNTSSDITLSSDDYNFRYVFIMACDANGKVTEVGNNLLTTGEASGKTGTWQSEITVPAGGFAISFFYNPDNTANKNAMNFYNAIVENCEYTDATPDNAVFNETVKLVGNDVYSMSYANGVVSFRVYKKSEANGLLGDVNDDKSIDTRDYVLVARSYMGTYTFTAAQATRADVNGDNAIDTRDYVLIARHYMGTYTING